MQVDVILFDWGGTLARVSRQVETLRAGAIKAARLATGLTDSGPLDDLISRVLTAEARAAKGPELREVDVRVKGPGSGRESAVTALQAAGISVRSIEDVTPLPHNGCRPRKKRRV